MAIPKLLAAAAALLALTCVAPANAALRFAPEQAVQASNPFDVRIADVDNDGHRDLVYVHGFDQVRVAYGDAAGVFSRLTSYAFTNATATPDCPVRSAAGVDLDRDGVRDLIVSCDVTGALDNIRVRMGKPDGGFGPTLTSNFGSTSSAAREFEVGDFNNDRITDV